MQLYTYFTASVTLQDFCKILESQIDREFGAGKYTMDIPLIGDLLFNITRTAPIRVNTTGADPYLNTSLQIRIYKNKETDEVLKTVSIGIDIYFSVHAPDWFETQKPLKKTDIRILPTDHEDSDDEGGLFLPNKLLNLFEPRINQIIQSKLVDLINVDKYLKLVNEELLQKLRTSPYTPDGYDISRADIQIANVTFTGDEMLFSFDADIEIKSKPGNTPLFVLTKENLNFTETVSENRVQLGLILDVPFLSDLARKLTREDGYIEVTDNIAVQPESLQTGKDGFVSGVVNTKGTFKEKLQISAKPRLDKTSQVIRLENVDIKPLEGNWLKKALTNAAISFFGSMIEKKSVVDLKEWKDKIEGMISSFSGFQVGTLHLGVSGNYDLFRLNDLIVNTNGIILDFEGVGGVKIFLQN